MSTPMFLVIDGVNFEMVDVEDTVGLVCPQGCKQTIMLTDEDTVGTAEELCRNHLYEVHDEPLG